VVNKWLSKTGAKFIQGACISEDSLVVWVECPATIEKDTGTIIGIDLGVNKLIATSEEQYIGRDFKAIRDKINRRKPGSKGRQRAYRERLNCINRTVNLIPWDSIKVLGVESLHDMKRGKQKDRGKDFRKAMAPWTYRQVINRVKAKAQENRVRLVQVPPANTSRTCPSCRTVSKNSRVGEYFRCVACRYEQDADYVGALEVLARTTRLMGSVESPMLQKVGVGHGVCHK
jgi:IS605 OrfB family transposase